MRLRYICATATIILASCLSACARGSEEMMNTERDEVRRPVVAGTFYPGDAAELAAAIDGYLTDAGQLELSGEIAAVIAPHAGYVYSGGVAGAAYAQLGEQSFDTVVVVAPSHRVPFRGSSVYGGSAYETPLGTVPVDEELADAIRGDGEQFAYRSGAHSAEHSLEVQIPFLQRTLKEFAIVPIVMGEQGEESVRALAGAITRAVEANSSRVLLVASTDLSHYHDQKRASALDKIIVDRVAGFDPEGLLADLAAGRCEACGGGPMAVVMMAARQLGADRSTVARYATSGDITGDMSQVVGYLSAVLTRPSSEPDATTPGNAAADDATAAVEADGGSAEDAPYEGLTSDERLTLLGLARATVEAAVRGEPLPHPDETTPALRMPCGGFVTLDKGGDLRGCIGYVVAVKPLHETVSEMAVQAALHDPRFPAVSVDELPDLEIEISVLSPLVTVADVSEIQVGRDGLVIRGRGTSGLLLPQVASERGWSRETFLDQACVKAGLPPGTWRDRDITIQRFSAEVFSEKQTGPR